MKNLGKISLVVGIIVLIMAVISRVVNHPLLGSKPLAILTFANSCFLLAIALILLEEKK